MSSWQRKTLGILLYQDCFQKLVGRILIYVWYYHQRCYKMLTVCLKFVAKQWENIFCNLLDPQSYYNLMQICANNLMCVWIFQIKNLTTRLEQVLQSKSKQLLTCYFHTPVGSVGYSFKKICGTKFSCLLVGFICM